MRLQPGMTVIILIKCRRCELASINIPNKDVDEAEEIAEQSGWLCTIRHGWTCPNCQ